MMPRALPHRGLILLFAILTACLFVALLTLILGDSHAAVILLDRKSAMLPYPWTIQNLMHALFFIGLGELFVRWRTAEYEHAFRYKGFLPPDRDETTVLQAHNLGGIRKIVKNLYFVVTVTQV